MIFIPDIPWVSLLEWSINADENKNFKTTFKEITLMTEVYENNRTP